MSKQHWSAAEKRRLRRDAAKLVIPHFASNAELAKEPKIFVRGKGCYVYDLDGRKYFDSFATLLTTVCGHVRSEVTRAVQRQMEMLEFFPNYVDAFTVPLIELARKLAELMPGELSVSFFVNSGSEANETAMKMARQYHVERGQPHRFKFIARQDSYHATTLGGGSVTGLTWFREYFEPLLPGCVFTKAARDCDRPAGMDSKTYGRRCLDELEKLILFEKPDSIAAMIMDPIPGSNTGYPLPPEGYLQGVRALADKYGFLLIFDEVQTGFGKTGKWFACEHWNVVPDIITIGKGFTGGFIPLGAAITTPKVADVFQKKPGHELRSGSTYGGHTTACAATLANLAIIEKEGLVENARRQGEYIRKVTQRLYDHPIVGEVNGIGLLWAIKLMADRQTKKSLDPKLGVGSWIRDWCYRRGMILRNNGDILILAPSLIITRKETDYLLGMVEQAIAAASRHFWKR
ncbi:MAG: aspartate aminotransferase family protein [Verrucomicrobiae bacterium]|nr:aspartate aminotransferase family protein [Verrucomicrobiae bacterium]